MLKEASVSELGSQGIPKDSRILVNRGRGSDELAPSDTLYKDFNSYKSRLEKVLGKGSAEAHNKAFLDCYYERRFRNQVAQNPDAIRKLEKIAKQAERKDIYLICYEGPTKACHRRILMRIAEEQFSARVMVDGVEPK